jgi:hypothetical protein
MRYNYSYMDIKEIIATLNRMQKDGVIDRYAIGGAYGAYISYLEPRYTADIDVFIHLSPLPGQSLVSLDPINKYLETEGYLLNSEGCPIISGWPVQFLPADDLLLSEALDQSKELNVDGVPVPVFTPEHLAAVALRTGRPKDKVRLIEFLETHALDEANFSSILKRHGLLDRWIQFKKNFIGNHDI